MLKSYAPGFAGVPLTLPWALITSPRPEGGLGSAVTDVLVDKAVTDYDKNPTWNPYTDKPK